MTKKISSMQLEAIIAEEIQKTLVDEGVLGDFAKRVAGAGKAAAQGAAQKGKEKWKEIGQQQADAKQAQEALSKIATFIEYTRGMPEIEKLIKSTKIGQHLFGGSQAQMMEQYESQISKMLKTLNPAELKAAVDEFMQVMSTNAQATTIMKKLTGQEIAPSQQPAQPAQPEQPGQPEQPAQPTQAGQPEQPGQPEQSAKPDKKDAQNYQSTLSSTSNILVKNSSDLQRAKALYKNIFKDITSDTVNIDKILDFLYVNKMLARPPSSAIKEQEERSVKQIPQNFSALYPQYSKDEKAFLRNTIVNDITNKLRQNMKISMSADVIKKIFYRLVTLNRFFLPRQTKQLKYVLPQAQQQKSGETSTVRTDKDREELANKIAQFSREQEPPTTERPTTLPDTSGEEMKSEEPPEQGFSDQDLAAAGEVKPPEQIQKPKKPKSFRQVFMSKDDFPKELKSNPQVQNLLTDLGKAIRFKHSIKESARFDSKKFKMILESELHYLEAKKEPKVFELSKRISELGIDDSLKQKLLELIKAELESKQIEFDYSAPQSADEPESDEEQVQQSAPPEAKSDEKTDQAPLVSALDSIIEQHEVKNRSRWEQMRAALSDLLGEKKQGTYISSLGDKVEINSIEEWAEMFATNCVDGELSAWSGAKRKKQEPDNTATIRSIEDKLNPVLKKYGLDIGIYIAKEEPVKIDPAYMRVVGGAEGGQFVSGQTRSGVVKDNKALKTAMVTAGN